jgi:branched-chain amino acid transport system substrate-binding protein/neutral amino acid transport system substrate-binding protein
MLGEITMKYRKSYRRHSHRTALQGGAIALLLFSTACQSTGGSGLKIGTLLPITGDLAQYGTTMQDSADLLVETVNGCGGVMEQPVELIATDDETDPAKGADGMTKLAEVDQVSAVVGAAASSVSSAAVDIAVRNQVVQISPSATSPVFTERALNGEFDGYWFRTAPPDTFQGQALAELAQQQGFEKVAVLAINNDYGTGLADSFTTAFEELGGTVVNADKPTLYAPDGTTFDSEVSTAFDGDPDAVLLVAYPETGSLILKTAYEQGLLNGDVQVLLTDGMKDDSIAELVGKTSDGKYIVSGMLGTAASAGGPGLDAFKAIYTAAFNRDPSVYDPNTWDAAALIVLAAEAAQDTTGTAIRDHIQDVANAPGTEVTDVCEALELVRQGEDINYQGASGAVDFDEQGDVVGSYDIWTVGDDGSITVKDTIAVGGS